MSNPKPGNTSSIRLHKRQLAWQILVPFFLMLVGILTAAAFVVAGAGTNTRLWADVSIIWLLLPALMFALLGLVLLVVLIYAIARLARLIPTFTPRVQSFFGVINAGARRLTDGVAKPVLWVNQAEAAIRSLFRRK